jgi:hypothetical protein
MNRFMIPRNPPEEDGSPFLGRIQTSIGGIFSPDLSGYILTQTWQLSST